MNYLKLLLFILSLCFQSSSSAQLTSQKKIVSRLSTEGIKSIDLKGNGILLISNFKRDSVFNTNPTSSFARGLYMVRLNSNFDTLWTKIIYNFFLSDGLMNNDNKIILFGTRNIYPNSCGSNIIKLDLNGNVLIAKTTPLLNCGTSVAGNILNGDVGSIIEYKNNAYIILNSGDFIKLNDNLDVIQNRRNNFQVSNFPFFSFSYNKLKKLNDSTIVTSCSSPFAFTANPYSADNSVLIVDTALNVKNYFSINKFNFLINSVEVNHNQLYLNGLAYDFNFTTNVFLYYNFLGKINLTNFLSPINTIKFNSGYSPNLNAVGYSNLKIFSNRLYLFGNSNFKNGIINDSLGINTRRDFYCLDTNLNFLWSKRLHLYNADYQVNLDSNFNNLSNNVNSQGTNFFFKQNNIITTTYDSQNSGFGASFSTNRGFSGFNITKIDTSGNNALCNATQIFPFTKNEVLGFNQLPLPGFVNNPYILNSTTIDIEDFGPQNILNKCLPIKPPISKFKISNLPPEAITCVNSEISVDDYSYNEPKTWQWIFPPQVDVSGLDSLSLPFLRSIKFTQAGIFPISLVTTNDAGTDTLTRFITVINFIPQPNIGNDTTLCFGDTLKIIYNDPPNSQHYFSGPSVYTESDTLNIFESGQYIIAAYTVCGYLYDTINVNVANKPTANFGFASTCNSLNVAFTDSSQLNFNPSLSYQYAFKQALAPPIAYSNFSTAPNNNYTFAAYDSFDVRLIVRSPLSCAQSDTIVKRIVLKAKPTAGSSFTNTCGSLAVNVTNNSSIAAGSITSYRYFVGNTLIASTPAFSYNFAAYGSYTIKQVAQSNFNCVSDTFFLPVVIKDKPVTSLSLVNDSLCANTNFTLTSNAGVNASTVTNYFWQINNGAVQNLPTNTRTDNLPTGIYNYKHWVRSSQSCESDTVYQTITVVSKPTSILTATNNCGSRQINITSAANVINDNITTHYVNYGDGNTSNTNPNNTTYTYNNYGSYTIKYVAKSSVGCAADTVFFPIVVKDKPVATIAYDNDACQNTNFVLAATATVAASNINNYTWIRNGAVLTTTTNLLTENQPAGNYEYKLVTRAANGCGSDTITQNVVVEQYPTTAFTAAGGCVGNNIVITNSSTSNNAGSGLTYAWATSDGQASTAIVPAFSFATSGPKTITLTATTPNGCATPLTQNITVDAVPTAAFDITEACLGKPIAITNNSTGAISNYTWQVVNGGQTSNAVTPSFTFNNEGNYSLKLEVSTLNNCSNTISKSTSIRAVRLFTTPAVDTTVVVNQPLQLNITGAATYLWSPGNNLSSTIVSSPTFKAATAGIYPLQIEGTTAAGCKGNASLTVKVFVGGTYVWIPSAFTPNGDGLNDRLRIVCSGLKSLTDFTMYNRYGQKVYEQTSCNSNGWNGFFNGLLQPTGSFVYTWQGIDFNDKVVSGKGSVLLVR